MTGPTIPIAPALSSIRERGCACGFNLESASGEELVCIPKMDFELASHHTATRVPASCRAHCDLPPLPLRPCRDSFTWRRRGRATWTPRCAGSETSSASRCEPPGVSFRFCGFSCSRNHSRPSKQAPGLSVQKHVSAPRRTQICEPAMLHPSQTSRQVCAFQTRYGLARPSSI